MALLRMVILTGLAFCSMICAPCVSAEEPKLLDKVYLRNGNVIKGKVRKLDDGKSKPKFYLIETSDGALIKLKSNQVKRVAFPTDVDRKYHKLLSEMPDTVDGHWQMQQWCVENKLTNEREFHLLRIIQLDPDHKDARLRLNYKDASGRWVHREQMLQNNGYVKDSQGRYRLPIGIKLVEQEKQHDRAVADWKGKLRTLRKQVDKRKGDDALKELLATTDPLAVDGLYSLYKKERIAGLRKELLNTIGQIQSYEVQKLLIKLAMDTDDRIVRDQCITLLKKPHFSQAGVVSALREFLRPTPATPNHRVNDAAFIIGEMGDSSAIRPLISALVTVHAVSTNAPNGNMNFSTDRTGKVGGMTMGSQPKYRNLDFRNATVLESLRRLARLESGRKIPLPSGNAEYDEDAWVRWLVQTRSLNTNVLNRDN